MYLVAVGVIDSETNHNWEWFMERLKEATGNPVGLTFTTDRGQPVMLGVSKVFPDAEHRVYVPSNTEFEETLQWTDFR
jgi:hypothetical protein